MSRPSAPTAPVIAQPAKLVTVPCGAQHLVLRLGDHGSVVATMQTSLIAAGA
jgi:hypothetical protein